MRITKINDIKVKVFEKKDLIEKIGFTDDEAKTIMKYQKTFPELLQDDIEGFVIDARKLWEQLDKPYVYYADWIKKKIFQKDWKENIDYITSSKKFEVVNNGYKKLNTHYFTIEMAKHVSLMENSPKGDLIRNYFINTEKALRNYEKWTMVREPQKIGYKQLSKALDENYKLNHRDKETPNFIYSNEADMINRALLNDSAKNINKLLESKDKLTREHLNTEINKTINELQTMDIALIMAGLDYESRKNTIENICNTKYVGISLQLKELKKVI